MDIMEKIYAQAAADPQRVAFPEATDQKILQAARECCDKGLIIPVVLTVYKDKSYTFILKTPPAAVLIKKALKLEKGSANPLRDKVGKLTKAQLEEIAKTKMPDINANDLEAAKKIVAGTARSMGVTVVD